LLTFSDSGEWGYLVTNFGEFMGFKVVGSPPPPPRNLFTEQYGM
jgi:hypothetical protein